MNPQELNNQVNQEIKNNKLNNQFLMIKDLYCIDGLKLTSPLACFFSFLVFMSDRFLHNNNGIKAFIGYSNKELARIYSEKWFVISERTVVQYLLQLKKYDLISIKNNGKINRKIYINYAKIKPELINITENEVIKEYQLKIEQLNKELEEVKQQNDLLLTQVIQQEDLQATPIGLFTKILYDKKYLTEKDNLIRTQLEDYNAMLKSFLFQYQQNGLDFFKSISYICSKAKNKKIKNKFTYLYTSLDNYLNRPDKIWDFEDEEE